MAGIGDKSPWKKLKGQCLLGGDRFIDKLSPYLEGKSSETEIPRQTKPERNTAIAQVHLFYGYSQQEIAGTVNLHYSTVSRIVRREKVKGKT